MNNSFLSLEQACYQAVHDYPGGVSAVAATFGWKASTLQNKLNPTQLTHKVTAKEVEGILQLTQDDGILDAICAQRNAVWIDLTDVGGLATDMALLDNINVLVTRVGELTSAVSKSLEGDNKVDRHEAAQLEAATMALTRAAHSVFARTKQFM